MLTANNGLDGVRFLVFKFSTAGNIQVPRAIPRCSGEHVGNIKTSEILHQESCFQGSPIKDQTWKKNFHEKHVGIVLFPQHPKTVRFFYLQVAQCFLSTCTHEVQKRLRICFMRNQMHTAVIRLQGKLLEDSIKRLSYCCC